MEPGAVTAAADALATAEPEAVVAWALRSFPPGRAVVVTGLQAEGVVVADMAVRLDPAVRVVTIDTGRLPDETVAYIAVLEQHLGRPIEVVRPDSRQVDEYVSAHGLDAIFTSVARRLDCCHIRKVEPLERVLAGADCWLTGLRRGQSRGRAGVQPVEVDVAHGGIVKVNPLAAWTEEQVHVHARQHGIPLNPLYAQGYRSIGCAPCTRAVREGEEVRAGRWWWEQGIDKECGIHGRPVATTGSTT